MNRISSSNLKSVVMGLVATVGFLLILEMISRVAATITNDLTKEQSKLVDTGIVVSREFGWILEPGFRGIAEATHLREVDSEGFLTVDSEQVADSATPKIVFIGDSNTFGYDVATEVSFVEIADRLLTEAHAINLGVSGYSSHQGLLVARKYIPKVKPDIAVVSFNFNDRRYVVTPDQVDGAAHFGRIYRTFGSRFVQWVRGAREYFYTYRGLRRVLRKAGLAPAEPAHETYVNLEEVTPRVDEAAYRHNLSEIATLCQANGVRPVFVLLRDNPLEVGSLRSGIGKLESGDTEGAIRELEKVIGQRKQLGGIARIYLAKVNRVAGKPDVANALLRSEVPLGILDGGNPIRLDTDYNRIMREVSQTYGIELIDAASVLEEAPDVFIDTCHFNEKGHRLVGELLAERISRLLADATSGAAPDLGRHGGNGTVQSRH